MITLLNIHDSILVLKSAIENLNEILVSNKVVSSISKICPNTNKIDIENKNNNNIHTDKLDDNKYNKSSKNILYKLIMLKILIELNLAESYYYIDYFKESTMILEKIFEDLTSERTLKYCESNNPADLSSDKEISKCFAKYYYVLGKIQYRIGNYQIAMDYFNQSINLRGVNNNEHKEDLAQTYNYMSLIYYTSNNYEKSIKFINKAYNIYWLLYGEDHIKTNMIYLNLSHIQKIKGENLKCLEILNKIKERSISGNNSSEKIFIAIFYRALGTFYFDMENEIKGLSYYSKANNIYKKYFNRNKITMNEINTIILNLFGLITI